MKHCRYDQTASLLHTVATAATLDPCESEADMSSANSGPDWYEDTSTVT